MDFKQFIDVVSQALELLGVGIMLAGIGLGAILAVRHRLKGERESLYVMVRRYFGQSILLGLEILIAADLIRTVTIDRTFESVAVLAVIVLVRTFLSFSLEIEIYGRVPWRGSEDSGDTRAADR